MASKEKLSVTLDQDVVRQIRELIEEGSFSEWLNNAAQLRLQAIMLNKLIEERGVVLTPEILAEVDAQWPW
jgi:Arc/MetJ-type ribon-helix-helix transcriptional regulator